MKPVPPPAVIVASVLEFFTVILLLDLYRIARNLVVGW